MPKMTIRKRNNHKKPAIGARRSRWRRIGLLAVLLAAALFFGLVLREAMFPFAGKPYIGITHGDHTHYVPKDRNETVPISSFPTRPPGPGERVTPDGDIIARD